VKNLCKKYGKRMVVNGVSFSVYKGEVFGFLGKNGAGKSTTINMITGIVRPTSGEVTLFGESTVNIKKLSKRLGVLPDSSNYYNDLTAYQHIKYFSSIKEIKLDHIGVLEILDLVGLSGDENKKVGSFSLGMKKKLGIAQALIGYPDVLFLDEPTSTLDPEFSIMIRDLIQYLARGGKTIFMTSHNLEEVEKICDRVAIMENGKITKLGSLTGLRKNLQSNLKVLIQSKQNIRQRKKYLSHVRNLGIQIEPVENGFFLLIDSDESIPELVALAVNQNIRVYGVEVEQPSLEEIFLNRTQIQA
jgi:ABC-2 type transport system ATP-binding protein